MISGNIDGERGEDGEHVLGLMDLPDDVLYILLECCSVPCLGRLARTCQKLNKIVSVDQVWRKRMLPLTKINCSYATRKKRLPIKEHYRLTQNWANDFLRANQIIRFNNKQTRLLQLEDDCLWVSDCNSLGCYLIKHNERKWLKAQDRHIWPPTRSDVCTFKATKQWMVSGHCDGSVMLTHLKRRRPHIRLLGHIDVVHSVDVHTAPGDGRLVVVSGSRDRTVRVWAQEDERAIGSITHQIISMNERIWTVAMQPNGQTFLAGTSGLKHTAPLSLWDTESGDFLRNLGENYREGAGVLDIHFDSTHMAYSCGYDTFIRLWDLRTSCTKCVAEWEDPFDTTIYCVKSDGENAIVSGTDRFGLVRLWDKRHTKPVQWYYTGGKRASSPVYALAFDSSHLYTALDLGVMMIDFNT